MPYQTWIADRCRGVRAARRGVRRLDRPGFELVVHAGRRPGPLDGGTVRRHRAAQPQHRASTGGPTSPGPLAQRLLGPPRRVRHRRRRAGQPRRATAATADCPATAPFSVSKPNVATPGDWTEAQLQNYPTLMAALVAGIGRDETWVGPPLSIGRHARSTPTTCPLPWFQTQTGAALAAGGRPDREDDDMTQTTRLLTSGVAAGRIAVADAHGQRHVFTGELRRAAHPPLVRIRTNGRWGHEALTGGLDPERGADRHPGRRRRRHAHRVRRRPTRGDTIVTAQWNPTAGPLGVRPARNAVR